MIDMSKKYVTRSGYKTTILSTSRKSSGPYSVVSLVHSVTGEEELRLYTYNGEYLARATSTEDLIEVKPRLQGKVWVNVYGRGANICTSSSYSSKELALASAGGHIFACVEVTIDCGEREGL